MSSITKSAKGYRVQVYVKGVRESKVFRTKREGEAWGAARDLELRTLPTKSKSETHTLDDAIDRYIEEEAPSHKGFVKDRIRLLAFMRDSVLKSSRPLSKFTPDELGKWRNSRSLVNKPGSVIRDCTLLGTVFEVARREWQWIDVNPMRDVKKPPAPDHRDILISTRQIKTMLRALDYQLKGEIESRTQATALCFLLALRTGMRSGELVGLPWERVKKDYLILPMTKTKPRHVPLILKSKRIVDRMQGFHADLVFGLTSDQLGKEFRDARKRAGLAGFTFHDARHTAATWLALKLSILDLCKMFGWKNPKQAMTYYNPTASQIAARIMSKKS